MLIDLPYGKKRIITLEVPDENIYFIIDRSKLPTLKNIKKKISQALKNPIDASPLLKMVKPRNKVLIIGDDITRPTPQNLILPTLLNELNKIGISDNNIEIIIGLGTHRYMTDKEIEEKYSKEVIERVSVLNHNYKDRNQLINMGKTESGIPISVNKKLYEADFIISTGNIVPHLTAGWGGGGKSIQPGVSGEETTEQTHIMAAKMYVRGERLVGDPDNKMRKEIEAVALKAGLKMIINTVLNEKDEISNIFIGDVIKAHRKGVEYAKQAYCPKIPGLADIVIVACHPADIDYWQGTKPLSYAIEAVKPRGTVILIAEFPDGISPTHPAIKDMGAWSCKEVLEAIEKGNVPYDDLIAASAMLVHSKIREKVEIICYSEGISESDKEALGMLHASTLEEAIEMAFKSQRKDAKVGILKCGEILPILEQSQT
ncbi:MAG: nickel-dependent lactate racemase [Candidatus Methanomethylicaceae archaeon]